MKNFNFALFLGCCVISIGIIIAGILISSNIPRTPIISGNFTMTDGTMEFRDYMSEYEASVFLMIEPEKLSVLMRDGQLYGTYTVVEGYSIFSKEKLTQWLDDRIEG